MVGLIVGIIVVGIPVGLAALVRSLRLESAKKLVLSVLSAVSMVLCAIALIGTILPELDKTFVKNLAKAHTGQKNIQKTRCSGLDTSTESLP